MDVGMKGRQWKQRKSTAGGDMAKTETVSRLLRECYRNFWYGTGWPGLHVETQCPDGLAGRREVNNERLWMSVDALHDLLERARTVNDTCCPTFVPSNGLHPMDSQQGERKSGAGATRGFVYIAPSSFKRRQHTTYRNGKSDLFPLSNQKIPRPRNISPFCYDILLPNFLTSHFLAPKIHNPTAISPTVYNNRKRIKPRQTPTHSFAC